MHMYIPAGKGPNGIISGKCIPDMKPLSLTVYNWEGI